MRNSSYRHSLKSCYNARMFSSRYQIFIDTFPGEKPFRWNQIETGFFGTQTSWRETTSLPESMRTKLEAILPWTWLREHIMLASKDGNTYKAALTTQDDLLLETVLMKNARGAWTICVSSQIGCAMNCSFCATGKMGFQRNLCSDEIIDQYRYWKDLLTRQRLPGSITNIVFMGMGEPMANYDNVRDAIRVLLKRTSIGPTKITVSSVGILPQMEELLDDPLWPPVRFAVSLHSADKATRKSIVPTSHDAFLERLALWAKKYLQKLGNRNHHLTFEHIMIDSVNDSLNHAKQLAHFIHDIDPSAVRVNLMFYNPTRGNDFHQSIPANVQAFAQELQRRGVTTTIRKSMGTDIDAACGQLIAKTKQ